MADDRGHGAKRVAMIGGIVARELQASTSSTW